MSAEQTSSAGLGDFLGAVVAFASSRIWIERKNGANSNKRKKITEAKCGFRRTTLQRIPYTIIFFFG